MFPWKRVPVRSRRVAREVPSMRRHILYGVLLMLAIVLLSTLVWYLTRLPFFTITTVSVSGGETISHETVRARALEVLAGSYLLLVPHRFAYLYPENGIRAAIESIPRAHTVEVTRVSRNEINISFAEYIPYALWCASDSEDTPCYFLDATGYAFAPAPQLTGGAFIRHIIEGRSELIHEQVFTGEGMARMEQFALRLESGLSLRVKEVVHTEDGDERYVLHGGGEIRISSDADMERMYESLATVLSSDEFSDLAPGNFQYIDLRFGSKIFVNDTMATTTEQYATSSDGVSDGVPESATSTVDEPLMQSN